MALSAGYGNFIVWLVGDDRDEDTIVARFDVLSDAAQLAAEVETEPNLTGRVEIRLASGQVVVAAGDSAKRSTSTGLKPPVLA
jgi:hypothetical protein